jgi:DNA-directed RNA polymerase specialized sigma24 family protein
MPGLDDRQERFERLFADSYRPVRAYVIRRAPAGAVEDVLSDVFLVAWRRLDSIAADPLPWLFGVARRVLANQRRGDRRHGALLDRLRLGAGFDDPGWQPPPGLRSELAAAVAALSATEREALLLVAWEGLTPERAARAVGCSPSAFRVRLHRARRHVATALGGGPGHARPSSSIPKGAP